MMSLTNIVSSNPQITIQQASLQGDVVSFIMTPQALAVIFIGLASIIAVLSVMLFKSKRKFKWVK